MQSIALQGRYAGPCGAPVFNRRPRGLFKPSLWPLQRPKKAQTEYPSQRSIHYKHAASDARMIPRIEAWKIGRTGEISNAMNSFGEVVPRGGLSGDASEASKINNLTSPQHSRLYQENVLCRLRMMGTSNLNFMAPPSLTRKWLRIHTAYRSRMENTASGVVILRFIGSLRLLR